MTTISSLLVRPSCSDRMVLAEGATGKGVTWPVVAAQAERWQACRPAEPVGLAIADPVAMASNFVAALCAGVVLAPLDPAAPIPELIGRLDTDGYLYLSGRDVINRGREKIQPRQVEEVLMSDPRVAAAVVVGRPHPTTGEDPVAYVLPAPGAILSPDQLFWLCAASPSRFKRPADITVADILPSGPTGKLRRAGLRALAAAVTERN